MNKDEINLVDLEEDGKDEDGSSGKVETKSDEYFGTFFPPFSILSFILIPILILPQNHYFLSYTHPLSFSLLLTARR